MPFFKVLPSAGAYLDDFHYAQDEIIEYHPSEQEYADFKAGNAMFWAQETDAAGNPVDHEQYEARTGNNTPGQRLSQTTNSGKTQTAPARSSGSTGGKVKEDAKDKAEKQKQIAESLTLLDPNDDAVWTETGLPKVEAVENVLGYNVTRPEIEEAQPGFKRPAKA